MSRRLSMQDVQERLQLPDLRSDIVRRYREYGQTQAQISRAYGIDMSTLSRWMQRLGIPARRWMLPPSDQAEKGVTEAAS